MRTVQARGLHSSLGSLCMFYSTQKRRIFFKKLADIMYDLFSGAADSCGCLCYLELNSGNYLFFSTDIGPSLVKSNTSYLTLGGQLVMLKFTILACAMYSQLCTVSIGLFWVLLQWLVICIRNTNNRSLDTSAIQRLSCIFSMNTRCPLNGRSRYQGQMMSQSPPCPIKGHLVLLKKKIQKYLWITDELSEQPPVFIIQTASHWRRT